MDIWQKCTSCRGHVFDIAETNVIISYSFNLLHLSPTDAVPARATSYNSTSAPVSDGTPGQRFLP